MASIPLITSGKRISFYAAPGLLAYDEDILGKGLSKGSHQVDELINKINGAVTAEIGISMDEMVSKKRNKTFVLARAICYYLIKKYTRLTYKEIGARYGGRDHSTVLWGLRNLTQWMKYEVGTCNTVNKIHDALKRNLVHGK